MAANKAERRAQRASPKGDARENAQVTGPSASRAGQRSRLIKALVELVAEEGYSQTKIRDLATRARVSRATFYELFTDKEQCFLVAQRELSARLSTEVEEGVAHSDPAGAARAALSALVRFADREPLAFDFLTHEAMLAGPSALEQRDLLIARLASQLDDAWAQARDGAPIPDLPARVLLGGGIRLLGICMRRGRGSPKRLMSDLIAWVDSYAEPRNAHKWRDIAPNARLVEARRDAGAGPIAPQPLPRGRHRLPVAVVRRVQRERILHATAEVIRLKGYANITVADIVATAGLSRDVFYAQFHGRREAFLETHKFVFELAATASAFFTSSGDWREQVWQGGRALADFLAAAPSLAHFGFVESYALGPAGAQRTDDAILAFTIFVGEDHGYRRGAKQPPSLVSEAIVLAAMETVAFYIRQGRAEQLIGLLPLVTYVVLAPFTGTDAARAFVERKMGETQAQRGSKA